MNDLIPFLEFVESSPVGARVAGVVDRYSSHGAYVAVGDVSVYVPLRSMADPPPKSARAHVKIGEQVDVTIVGFVADVGASTEPLMAASQKRPHEKKSRQSSLCRQGRSEQHRKPRKTALRKLR